MPIGHDLDIPSSSGPLMQDEAMAGLYFANDYWKALSCWRGFSYWGNEESAAVQPNAAVSLYFFNTRNINI
jgi:hypothetical protein